MSKDSSVSTILYQPSPQQLDKVGYNQIGEVGLVSLSLFFTFHFQSKGEVDLLAGLVWLSPPVAESLLKLHSLPPVDACTYIGADSGGKAQNTKFSLSQFSPKGPRHLPLL